MPVKPPKIIARFAPSPTGFLHVGSLRTALYNYIFAKKNNGLFYLRVEDTDQSRKVEGAKENLLKILAFFNLNWDNKPIMIQSERLDLYKKYAQQLIDENKAYYCFCSEERLGESKAIRQRQKLPTGYDGQCRNLSAEEIKNNLGAGRSYVIRFKMPKTGLTEFIDLIRGQVSFDNKILDDQIILKSNGWPTYHLASVIDDHEMEISHVIRGEDWLPSTPKHILLYQAFGWEPPIFAHLPLLLNPDHSKLSKRQGDVAVEDFLKNGYLPEALLNFILLLGWNPGTNQEIFDLQSMIEAFSLEKINKAGAVFDLNKLDWLNGEYIRKKSAEELAKLCQPYYAEAGLKTDLKNLKAIVATEQSRIKKLSEIVSATEFFFKAPDYDPQLLIWKKLNAKETAKNLAALAEELEKIKEKEWTEKFIEAEIKKFIEGNKQGMGDYLWPMRAALSGRKASPGPFEIAGVLGREETLKRLEKAIEILK
ncbi:MAG: glutamate--tRNA ligase [Candidatus Buchananbacteria bacterium RIFCSPHIGHO2_02_FULL_45_11b]|uniref:Glutamate--tRNA ligase n=2 Tax=Candidatus Buchananiibacteriota TaxID=1817903 RepID=A0A1G1YF24_9BACT|nr:MAG: glutamate--tRNA ligase [Candidatus Buchananbacteria bacterium RIFCSPHIGHO2_02_FULL_45_11b]OGY56220.1 MAG: glutamate--tRNA ligase [Candidatus Buchananbacteria bacterium RIFCSPLOWO2_02_FULL_46_11b]